MKNYDPVTITTDQLDAAGYALSADSKQAVIGALAGETVIAVPWARKRKKHFFKTDTVLQASIDRVTPICPAANDCGGCSFQHFEPVAQIRFKADNLRGTLADTQPLQFMEPITGPTYDYRSKARLGVKFVEKKGRVLVGFREKMKPHIAEIDRCYVLRASVGENLLALSQMIGELSDPRSIPQIEVAVGDTETALVFRHLSDMSTADLSQLSEFGRQLAFSIYLQPGNESTVHKIFPADGVERLSYSLPDFNLTYAFHPMDFTQVNHQINQKMIRRAIDLLALKDTDRVFDGFCGIGNFSLPLARTAGYVRGVELSQTCVQRANENAGLNQIENIEFSVGDLFADNQDKTAFESYNKVLLDPPRSGALEVCKVLATHHAERVVYVSCNPVTLARDAEILVAGGYQFESAGVIDMFPHTTHVESIACFTRA